MTQPANHEMYSLCRRPLQKRQSVNNIPTKHKYALAYSIQVALFCRSSSSGVGLGLLSMTDAVIDGDAVPRACKNLIKRQCPAENHSLRSDASHGRKARREAGAIATFPPELRL